MNTQETFALALQHHQAGRLEEAEALYRQVLNSQPNHADALHFLGVLAGQAGRQDVAVDLMRQAIAINPHNFFAYSNLGGAYRTLGRVDEAMTAYRRAIQIRPDFPDAHNNLGTALAERGQFNEAEVAFRRAIQLQPNYPEACNNLGQALAARGRFNEAVVEYRRAIQLRPGYAEAHNNLGVAFTKLERLDEAVAAFQGALELQPDDVAAHYNLGIALAGQNRFDEAIAAYRRALEREPGRAQVHNNLGVALTAKGLLDEAMAAYRRALQLQPADADAHINIGVAWTEQGQWDEAVAAFRRALQFQSDSAGAKFNLAMLLLLRGDWERGWPLFEARAEALHYGERPFSQPRWDGRGLHGQRVLLHAEQGHGDAIHFIRYASLVAGRGGEVVVECWPSLTDLFRSAKGVGEVMAFGGVLPPFDLHVPMLGLPLVFQTTPESIPGETPYLFAESSRSEAWKARLGRDRARLRVGLAWAGNRKRIDLRKRHIPLERLLPCAQVSGVDFFSLQVDGGAEQLRRLPGAAALVDHTAYIHDFADTAAFMGELDLIISVDTAVAHLAGALGRPVWTMLPFVPDWRWGLEGETTPWYPTMRLFRQPAFGDWDSVIQRVTEELDRMVTERVSAQ